MSEEFEKDFLAHYGTPRHSGRYPWGSGKKPQRSKNFVSRVDYYRSQGYGDTEISKMEGISTTEFRKRLSIAANEEKRANIAMAQRLKEKGMSNVAIAKRMEYDLIFNMTDVISKDEGILEQSEALIQYN